MLQLYTYNEKNIVTTESELVDDIIQAIDMTQNNWLNIDEPVTIGLIEAISKTIDLHPIIIEDLISKEEEPKVESYEDQLFAGVKMIKLGEQKAVVHEEVNFVMKKNLLITFQEGVEGDVFSEIRNRLTNNIGKVRKSPIDYLLWRLLDKIIKEYHEVLEFFRTEIEIIEDDLMAQKNFLKTKEIIHIKRELNVIRKFVYPLKSGLSLLHQESNLLIQPSTLIYFKDLLDHIIQIEVELLNDRDMIGDLIELQNANQSQHMNEIMKTLTIISSIFIPLTFLVGLYGMNFEYFPELHYHYSYFILWFFMILLSLFMWLWFKRRNWL